MTRFIKSILKLLVLGIFVPRAGDTLLKGIMKIILSIGLILAIILESNA